MKTVRLEKAEYEGTPENFLCLVRESVDAAAGYVLAESPSAVWFRPWHDDLNEKDILPCTSVVVFSGDAEIRLEKISGTRTGRMRLLRCIEQNSERGEAYVCREQLYLLRREYGSARLRYTEYFREDEAGMLVRDCGRLSGLEGEVIS